MVQFGSKNAVLPLCKSKSPTHDELTGYFCLLPLFNFICLCSFKMIQVVLKRRALSSVPGIQEGAECGLP